MAKKKLDILTDEELLTAFVATRPDLWAETYLHSPMDPTKPLVLRDYQRKILQSRSQRKILRMGRRTGKSVVLVVEALWKAFTIPNRQVLIIAAYETQVDSLFEYIKRMALPNPDIEKSVTRMKSKPHEIWFSNGSVIRGMVANSSVRGKCLLEGSYVLMADNTYKRIEEIQPGEKVVVIDFENKRPAIGTVKSVMNNGIQEVYRLTTTSSRKLILTDNHPLVTFGKGWVQVKDLKPLSKYPDDSDFVLVYDISMAVRWTRVKDIEYVGKGKVYDLEIDKYHNFIAFYPNKIEESGFLVSKLYNGGFVVHNSADDLIIDEADYISQDIIRADIWPIATTYKHTTVTMSSTPTGRREFFYTISVNKDLPEYNFTEFHIPSTMSPEWTPEHEKLVRSITTKLEFEHEYLAEFGSAVDGVFRHRDVDACLYVYDYNIPRAKNSYLTMGVDWNESRNGVQIILLEFLHSEVDAIPYNNGEWRTASGTIKGRQKVSQKFRVFRRFTIDVEDYVNTKAVDFILEIIKQYRPDYCVFDHGHGHTNWELLRLSLKQGQSPTGRPVIGLKDYADRMDVLDFSSTIETNDPFDDKPLKYRAKNFIVKLTQSVIENHALMIPAVDERDESVENGHRDLIAQIREYNVARVGDRGEVYEAGSAGDHILDALMLAIYAYSKEHSEFLHYDYTNIIPTATQSEALTPKAAVNRQLDVELNHGVYKESYVDGVLVRDWGNWTGQGEPPDIEPDGKIEPQTKKLNHPVPALVVPKSSNLSSRIKLRRRKF